MHIRTFNSWNEYGVEFEVEGFPMSDFPAVQFSFYRGLVHEKSHYIIATISSTSLKTASSRTFVLFNLRLERETQFIMCLNSHSVLVHL